MTKHIILQITYQSGAQYNVGCENHDKATELRNEINKQAAQEQRKWIEVIPNLHLLKNDFNQQVRSIEIYEVEKETEADES